MALLKLDLQRKLGNTEVYDEECKLMIFPNVGAADNWVAVIRRHGNWNVRKSRYTSNTKAGREAQRKPNSACIRLYKMFPFY